MATLKYPTMLEISNALQECIDEAKDEDRAFLFYIVHKTILRSWITMSHIERGYENGKEDDKARSLGC
ncbi:hypothetical protein LCGC14_2277990 [marine sediment metagenome]|uniref:Uncharacterized protein n=1 Tax=marine sediment metagenome TaxID=412755 RepID=A0A0F9CUX8_9ZZZZ